MAILVSAHNVRKAFAARPLFDGLTFAIETGERIGLIGPNGAGKSTLLRILASQASPDDGTISFQRGLRVGFLEQVPDFKKGISGAGTADHEAVVEEEEGRPVRVVKTTRPTQRLTASHGGTSTNRK